MPKRILLTTLGSFGDLHPYMALALELKRRGHAPVIGTGEQYREKVETAGLEFAPIAPRFDLGPKTDKDMREVMDPKVGAEILLRHVVNPSLRASYDDTFRAADACDLIVSHVLTYSAPIVAEQKQIPWVFTALQPLIFFSAIDASVLAQAPWMADVRRIGGPKLYAFLMDLGIHRMRRHGQPLAALRHDLGLPANGRAMFRGQFSPHLNLALFSRAFAPPAQDWPAKTIQTGFAFYDSYDQTQQTLPEDLKAFLDAGDPPVVFTLGTAAVRSAGEFFRESLAAARVAGRRAVLLTGKETGNENGLDLKDDAIAVPYAPYSELFTKAAVIVHQGGIGTTGQALRAGRPMLVMPYGHDQPDNAARCARLGVGMTIERHRYTAQTVANALKQLLEEPSYRASAGAVASEIAGENGPSRAADAIEVLL